VARPPAGTPAAATPAGRNPGDCNSCRPELRRLELLRLELLRLELLRLELLRPRIAHDACGAQAPSPFRAPRLNMTSTRWRKRGTTRTARSGRPSTDRDQANAH